MKIFGFDLEFNHQRIRDMIKRCCQQRDKGYVCIVDGPSLVRSYTTPEFMEVLNGAYFNSCDGGSIASMASRLYKQDLRAFTGPEIFAEFIPQSQYTQIMLGNTQEKFDKVMAKLTNEGQSTSHIHYVPLPFCTLDEFDYPGIAREIEALNADIIWVSLGAPKQEYFMNRLLPYLNRGIMLGVGAAFAFYLGELKDFEFRIGEHRFNWLYRLLTEPRKQFKRVGTILRYYPTIYNKERIRIKTQRQR